VITAVDSSVLIDVLIDDPRFSDSSTVAVRDALVHGAVVVCDVVWAEIAGWGRSDRLIADAMGRLGIGYSPVVQDAAALAGRVWSRYRAAGRPRDRMVPDFLVGAHALTQADRLLTRDRGFYRRYFGDLTIVDPMKDS
jgi:predicted nucleic acid-binding protein